MWFKKGNITEKQDSKVYVAKRLAGIKNDRLLLKKGAVILLGVVIAGVFALYAWGEYRGKQLETDNTELTNEQKYAQQLLSTPNTDEARAKIVEEHGEKFDKVTEDLKTSTPDSWNKPKLNDAYAALLYADKIESFNEVFTVLASIESAKKQGLNIDDNSYGINQQTRDEIKQRAEALVKQRREKSGVQNL